MLELEIQYECADQITPTEDLFKLWATAAVKDQAKQTQELVIRIVTTTESAELNKEYRAKDSPTNVLSFSDEEIPGFPSTALGTLVMCPEIITQEAEQLAIDLMHHWAHLTIHGVLHLQDYDHVRDDEASIMEMEEIKILANFNISNPYTIKDDNNG